VRSTSRTAEAIYLASMGLERASLPRLVSVNYREVGNLKRPYPQNGYVYIWSLPSEPTAGTWVWVEGAGGLTTAMVCHAAANMPDGFHLGELKAVVGLVDDRRVKTATSTALHDRNLWMDKVRAEALAPSLQRPTEPDSEGRVVCPASGDASPADANRYYSAWWPLYKQGVRAGWSEAEAQRFAEIGRRWRRQCDWK